MKRIQLTALLLAVVCCSRLSAEDLAPTNTVSTISSGVFAAPQPITNPVENAPARPRTKRSGDDDQVDVVMNLDYFRSVAGDYESQSGGSIAFEFMTSDRDAVGLLLRGGAFQLKRGSVADRTAHQPFIGEVGLTAKHYFTHRRTLLQPYLAGNLTLAAMAWEYRRPMVFGGETWRADYLEGLGAYGGCGLSIRVRKQLNLFGEVGTGGILFAAAHNGKSNDTVFGNFAYVGGKVGLQFVF